MPDNVGEMFYTGEVPCPCGKRSFVAIVDPDTSSAF